MYQRLLFITASKVSVALVNRLLLHLRDWQDDGESTWGSFQIVYERQNLAALAQGRLDHQPTIPPLQTLPPDNEFEGNSLNKIEAVMINDRGSTRSGSIAFCVLDDKGIEDGTLVVAEQFSTWSESDQRHFYTDDFRKARVPWHGVNTMWANIEIANLSFEEFCVDGDTERGAHGDYWFTLKDAVSHRGGGKVDAAVQRREAAIDKLEKLGLA